MNKKPISKIIQLGKVKEFAITDDQAKDPKFDLDLGDTVTLKVIGKVVRSADAGENLFSFSRESDVKPEYSFLDNVKKYEKEEEKEEDETDEVETVSPKRKLKVKVG